MGRSSNIVAVLPVTVTPHCYPNPPGFGGSHESKVWVDAVIGRENKFRSEHVHASTEPCPPLN